MASFTAASNNTTIWANWTDVTANTTSATISPIQVWNAWTVQMTQRVNDLAPYVSSEEARAQAVAAVKKKEKARENARKLLLENLSDQQKEELQRKGFFHVETRDGRRRYRLGPTVVPQRVHGEDGKRFSYCIHPLNHFPAEDVTLALKLMLEADEDEFLRTANATAHA